MTQTDLALPLDWAAAEGWNPGFHDAPSFLAADPDGFLLGELDGRPVGSGKPGPLWRRVHDELQRYKRELSGTPW